MNVFIPTKQSSFPKRLLCALTAFFFLGASIFPSVAIAQALPQTILNLPIPGSVVSTTAGFAPAIIKGVNLYPDNPLKFDFIIDKGDAAFTDEEFKTESTKLIKYFLSSLTVPENEMWVNLSPYEKNRIVPQDFGKTEMGRDLLAQDYMLKQLTASLMNPDDKLGGEFWQRVYTKAQEKYGTTDIPMNTFNKIWIVPEKAVVYEHEKGAFVVKSHLKVLLEEDYLALDANKNSTKHGLGNVKVDDLKVVSGVQSAIIKDLLIPEIEKEVNEGQTFANLRQIYNAVILASWYKQALKESLLGQVYIDQKKTKGVETDDKTINQKIYNQYVESFKKGVYNYIKEDYNPETQEVVNRKYFSGGIKIDMASLATKSTLDLSNSDLASVAENSSKVEVDLASVSSDSVIVSRTIQKVKIIDVGPNGIEIFANLLFNDILENVSVKEVRVKPNLDQNKDKVQKIAGNNFDKVWAILRGTLIEEPKIKIIKPTIAGTIKRIEFINGVGSDGVQIVDDLIMEDILENVSSTEVRLKPNLDQKKDKVREIAGIHFKKIWAILQKSLSEEELRGSKIRIINNDRTSFQLDLFHAVKGLGGLINKDFLGNQHILPVNARILKVLAAKFDQITLEGIDPDHYDQMLKDYVNYVGLIAEVLYSDAWLSPTYSDSSIPERGILQGEQYSSSYERDELDPQFVEKQLGAVFSAKRSLLFKNKESLFNELLGQLFGSGRRIYVSSNLPQSFVKNAERLTQISPRVGVKDSKNDDLLTTLSAEKYDDIIIDANDTVSLDTFLEQVVALNKTNKKFKNIFVYSNQSLNAKISDRVLDDLFNNGISLYGIYDINALNIQQSVHLDVPSSPAYLALHTNILTQDSFILDDLFERRKLGGNIDSFSDWYLSLLTFQTNNKDLDQNSNFRYFRTIDPKEAMKQKDRLVVQYTKLKDSIKSIVNLPDPANGILMIIFERIQEHIDALRKVSPVRGPPSNPDIEKIREAIGEYRALVKFYLFFKRLEYRQIEDHQVVLGQLEERLEKFYNDLTLSFTDYKGAPVPQSSLLFSSGMGTIKSLLHFLSTESKELMDRKGILVGNNIYFEIEDLNKHTEKERLSITRIKEREIEGIVSKIKEGNYKALMVEPIANALTRPFGTGRHQDQEDIPVTDIHKLLDELLRLEYNAPFYLVLDISAYGSDFQLSEFLNGKSLPENFHIVLYGSLQKLYQEGMELTTGGGMTVFSNNPIEHKRVISGIRNSRDMIGVRSELSNYLSLDFLWQDEEKVKSRVTRISKNAEELAKHMEKEFASIKMNGVVIHPSLNSHRDHNVWVRNGQLGFPFIVLRFDIIKEVKFQKEFDQNLKEIGLNGLQGRDSYGFNTLTYTYYYGGTSLQALRISMAPFDDDQMQKVKLAFDLTFNELFQKESQTDNAIFTTKNVVSENGDIDSKPDSAMAGKVTDAVSIDTTSDHNNKGGIDLNPTILSTEIKRNGRGVIIPAFRGEMPNLNGIEGFIPNIINVTPITNLQLLLGLDMKSNENPRNPDNEKPVDVSFNLSALPAKERE